MEVINKNNKINNDNLFNQHVYMENQSLARRCFVKNGHLKSSVLESLLKVAGLKAFYRTHSGDCFSTITFQLKCCFQKTELWQYLLFVQKKSPRGVLKKCISEKFHKIPRKTPVSEPRQSCRLKAAKRLWHRCFLENLAKFLRTPFLKEHLRWLLLFVQKNPELSRYYSSTHKK